MAETPEKSKQQPIDLDDDDEIISLSDAELDTILGSAEITDAPIADIEIDLVAAPAARPQPVEEPLAETAGGGFFIDDEDETISLPEDELETILDTGSYPDDQEQPVLPEPEVVLAVEEEALRADALEEDDEPSIGAEPAVVPDFAGPETPIRSAADDSFVIIDDQPLDSPEMGLDGSSMIVEEEISTDTTMPELDFAREQAARSTDEPVVEIAGDSLDELFDEDEEISGGGIQPDQDGALDDFELEDAGPEIRLDASPAAGQGDAPGFDSLAGEQAEPDTRPVPPEFSLEEGAVDFDNDGIDDLLIEEAPVLDHEPASESEMAEEIIDIEDELIELEPVERREDLEDAGRSEVVFEDEVEDAGVSAVSPDESVPVTAPAASALPDDGFVRAPDFSDDLPAVPLEDELAEAVPVIDQVELTDEPVEFMEDEIVFAARETIPAAEPDQPAAQPVVPAGYTESPDEDELLDEEIINPDLISEMTDEVFDEPEAVDEPAAAVAVEDRNGGRELVEGLPERMRDDVRKVLGYLDNLFDELPEEKVKEFANSEYYDIYSRLFKELGI